MKMRLHATTTSPYVRKVLVVAYEIGLMPNIQLIPTNPHTDEYLRNDNPLCKIPTLILESGNILFDSPVICEYLDSLSSPKFFPVEGLARWNALRMQALGDGLLDILLSRRAELMRPKSEQSQKWLERWDLAVSASLDWLEAQSHLLAENVTIGHVSVGCALGFIELRFPTYAWCAGRPNLERWWQRFKERPSMLSSSFDELSKLPLGSSVSK